VQRGDLTDGTLAELLQTLSTAQVTGALHVRAALAAIRVPNENAETPPGADPLAELEADEAVVYLRNGEVYSARAPGPRPLLGTRLVTEGIITRQALAEPSKRRPVRCPVGDWASYWCTSGTSSRSPSRPSCTSRPSMP